MSDCLFCRIARKDIPAKIAYEDEEVIIIHDIQPQAPVHVLAIPKRHIGAISDLQDGDAGLVGRLICSAKRLAAGMGWKDYRLVFNNGAGAGQSVFHIHLHLLSGRAMSWPPG